MSNAQCGRSSVSEAREMLSGVMESIDAGRIAASPQEAAFIAGAISALGFLRDSEPERY